MEMCFPNEWTWHITLETIKSRREQEIEEVEKKLQYKKSFSKRIELACAKNMKVLLSSD